MTKLYGFVLMLLLLTAVVAPGSVIISTFGPGYSFSHTSGWGVGMAPNKSQEAVPFVPSATYVMESLTIAAVHTDGPNELTVYLTTSLGSPAIESFLFSSFGSWPGTAQTTPSALHPVLAEGTTYWIVATAPDLENSGFGWNFNDQGYNGEHYYSGLASSFAWVPYHSLWPAAPYDLPAFELTGTSVPEPSTLGLISIGIAFGLITFRRKPV